MRTTVTLDPDVASLLRKQVRQSGEPFKRVLNNAVRAGLRGAGKRAEPFRPLTFDMGKPRADLTKALALAAELEDEELIRSHRRVR
ncbi:MAG: antitoxin [Steroidobacteraceae bacterium]